MFHSRFECYMRPNCIHLFIRFVRTAIGLCVFARCDAVCIYLAVVCAPRMLWIRYSYFGALKSIFAHMHTLGSHLSQLAHTTIVHFSVIKCCALACC